MTTASTASAGAPAVTRATLLAAAPDGAEPLSDRRVRRAIRYNERRWEETHRVEILSWLRDSQVAGDAEDAEFGAGDVRTIARLQRGAGFEDRRIDGRLGRATMAVLLLAGLELSPKRASSRRIELWFYPGSFEDLERWRQARARARGTPEKERYEAVLGDAPSGSGIIYVLIDGQVVDLIEARGGPPFRLLNGSHSADPSEPGRYRLRRGEPYQTDNWVYSQIPWGASLRQEKGEIQFRPRGEKRWRWATGPKSRLTYPLPREDFYDADGVLMAEWRMNEFGAVAWRLKGSPGLLIHTTPTLEEKTAAGIDPELTTSHGCLHVKPVERDRLVERGYLRRGVNVVIKRYEDHLLPRKLRERISAHRGS